MRGVDEGPQVIRSAVQPCRREQVDAVVAPAESSGEVGDGHHLDDGDAELGESGQLLDRRSPRALPGERADVHLVKYLVVRADARPIDVRPGEEVGIDHFGRTHRSLRLEAGGRVGKQVGLVVQPIPVKRTGAGAFDRPGEVAVGLRFEGKGGKCLQTFSENDCDLPSLRSPHAEIDTLGRQLGANRKPARAVRGAGLALAGRPGCFGRGWIA